VRPEVSLKLNFDFQLILSLGDKYLLYEHSEARVTYCFVFVLLSSG